MDTWKLTHVLVPLVLYLWPQLHLSPWIIISPNIYHGTIQLRPSWFPIKINGPCYKRRIILWPPAYAVGPEGWRHGETKEHGTLRTPRVFASAVFATNLESAWWFQTPLKNMSQLGWLFQTTNQELIAGTAHWILLWTSWYIMVLPFVILKMACVRGQKSG